MNSGSSSPTTPEGRYLLGYSERQINDVLGRRTATREASFVLPYLAPGMSLVDCGCGPGTITVGLASLVKPGRVRGIDIEGSQFRLGMAGAEELGLDNVEFEVGDVHGLDLASESADVVFANGLLYHLCDPVRALIEMKRVLKPGGILAIRDYDDEGTMFWPTSGALKAYKELFVRIMLRNGSNPHFGRQHRELLRRVGFDRIEISASYDVYSSGEATRSLGEYGYDFLHEASIVELVTAEGWATAEQIAEIAQAARDWGRDPDAFLARSRCEAIAHKS
jgi:ubiquinone/menaquinone biosynthesis C-methylase UbiE